MKVATGTLKGRSLESPKNVDMRPTTEMCRQALFNICQHICEGATFLDLFAGSGAMGIEALSRGAKSVTFVDSNSNCIKCIKSNLEKLDLKNMSKVVHGDVFDAIKRLAKQSNQYDIIYVDPPYHDKHDRSVPISMKVILAYEELATHNHQLLTPNGYLFVEDGIELNFSENPLTYLVLKNVRHLGRAVLHEFCTAGSE